MAPLAFVCSSLFGLVAAVSIQPYASKYEHIDVNIILNNRRMVEYYAACLLNKGPCPPEGVEFKRILPEALKSNCQRCSEKQKAVSFRAIKRLKKEYPKIWSQLLIEWDPDGTHISKFENTFINSRMETTSTIPIVISNRFDIGNVNDINENTVSSTTSIASTSIIKQRISNTRTTQPTTMAQTSTTDKIISTTQKIIAKPISSTDSSQIIATKPIATHTIPNTYFPRNPEPYGSQTYFGATVQSAVSSVPNIVGDVVNGIGAIGNRVAKTGFEVAEVLLKNILTPL